MALEVFDENDYVELVVDLSNSLPKGTRGAVVMVYGGSDEDYEVEFVRADGTTVALETVNGAALSRVAT